MGSTWAVGSIGVAPAGAVFPVGGQPVATVGAADDRPGAAGGLAGVAFAVELDDHVGAQGGVLLVAADPLIQLGRRTLPGRQGTRVITGAGIWCDSLGRGIPGRGMIEEADQNLRRPLPAT
jgi:hypothetical protein